jgi:transcriptional regulator GlxA family with amidase domain
MGTRRIGILGYEHVTALDIAGPADVFATASDLNLTPSAGRAYEVILISPTGKPFTSDAGLVLSPAKSFKTAPALDTLIIPGGHLLRDSTLNLQVAAWIKSRASHIRRIASVCTGIYGLAPTGLLDGRRVATHWKFAADVARRFPKLKVDPDAIFIRTDHSTPRRG